MMIAIGYGAKDVHNVSKKLREGKKTPLTAMELLKALQTDELDKALTKYRGEDELRLELMKYRGKDKGKPKFNQSKHTYLGSNIETEVRQWKPLSPNGLRMLTSWNIQLGQSRRNCSVGQDDSFETQFSSSNALEIILEKLLGYFCQSLPDGVMDPTRSAVLKMFGFCLCGTPEYHESLVSMLQDISKQLDKDPTPDKSAYVTAVIEMFTYQKHLTKRAQVIAAIVNIPDEYDNHLINSSNINYLSKKYFNITPLNSQTTVLQGDPNFQILSWNELLQSAHQSDAIEARLQQCCTVLEDDQPMYDLQLNFHYLEGDVQSIMGDTVTDINKKWSDIAALKKKIQVYQQRNQFQQQQPVQMNNELQKMHNEMQILRQQNLNADSIHRMIVEVYRRLCNYDSNGLNKVATKAQLLSGNWLGQLLTHILNCDKMKRVLEGRIYLCKEKLKNLQHNQNLTVGKVNQIKSELAALKDEDTEILKCLEQHVTNLFNRMERFIRIVPMTEGVFTKYNNFLKSLEMVKFDLKKVGDTIATAKRNYIKKQ